jgi:hypothetical protein
MTMPRSPFPIKRNTLWSIKCDRAVFENCQADPKFPYVLALSRAVNALAFTHSALIAAGEKSAPSAQRSRQNSYLFASAILLEALELIRKMKKTFKDDDRFKNGLGQLLKDKTVLKLEARHLRKVRNHAVFHFAPDEFARILGTAAVNECVFLKAKGPKEGEVYYSFADVIAAEILVGYGADTDEFYKTLEIAMSETRDLVLRLEKDAKELIGHYLLENGFGMTSD